MCEYLVAPGVVLGLLAVTEIDTVDDEALPAELTGLVLLGVVDAAAAEALPTEFCILGLLDVVEDVLDTALGLVIELEFLVFGTIEDSEGPRLVTNEDLEEFPLLIAGLEAVDAV